MRFATIGCAAALLLSASCGDGAGPGCDVCSTSAEVSGRVTDAAGRPVPDAAVGVAVYRESCAGDPQQSRERVRVDVQLPSSP